MAYQLTISPLKPSEIPSDDVIIETGRKLLESTASWKPGKVFGKHAVRTFRRDKEAGDGAPWHCRVSEHTKEEVTFDEMWDKLGRDKAVNEMGFIPNIRKTSLVKRISATQEIWTLYYTFTPPISPRVFTVLQVTHLNLSTPRTGIIVSIPVDLTDDKDLVDIEERGTKGRYASVEQILELEDGRTEWRMATSSTPGGMIPSFVAENALPGQIASDVSHFLTWLHQGKPSPPETSNAQVEAAT